jgi:hypothetical protein
MSHLQLLNILLYRGHSRKFVIEKVVYHVRDFGLRGRCLRREHASLGVFRQEAPQAEQQARDLHFLGTLQRLDYALFLHRKTGLPIVVSGGSVKGDTTPLAQLGGEWLQRQAGVTPMAVESGSRDTRENALNSAEALRARGIEKVLLVTHAYHMPRALLNARTAGIDAIPAPFGFESVPPALQRPGELGDWLPKPGYLGRSYLILHEMLGLAWYRLNLH